MSQVKRDVRGFERIKSHGLNAAFQATPVKQAKHRGCNFVLQCLQMKSTVTARDRFSLTKMPRQEGS